MRKFGLLGLALTGLLLSPTMALARHHHHESEYHERWERRPHVRGHFYYGPAYRYGYYDRWGYWHPYR